jgi:hypothetical protein
MESVLSWAAAKVVDSLDGGCSHSLCQGLDPYFLLPC